MTERLRSLGLDKLRVAFVFDHWFTPGGGQQEVLALYELFPAGSSVHADA